MSDPLNPPPVEPTPEVPAAPAAQPAAPAAPATPAAPTYAAPVAVPPTNGFATAAIVLGIIALVLALLTFIPFAGPFFFGWIGFICAVLAIIFGVVGLNRAKRNSVGRSKSQLGLIFGIVSIVLGVIALIVSIAIGAAIIANSGGLQHLADLAQACAGQPSGTVVTLSDGSTGTCP